MRRAPLLLLFSLVAGAAELVVTAAREPPSRLPAVNSNGWNMSLRPGSGRAPRRFNCSAT